MGGQVQRILFLDEATNWLDNGSQAEVMRDIDRLEITHFFVAHRLSTIRNADHIFVLNAGKIVQHGTDDELIEVEGAF